MEQPTSSLQAQHHTTLKGHITQLLNPVHHLVISTFYYLFCDLILTCSLFIFKLLNFLLNLSFFNWFSSKTFSSPNFIKTIHIDCNLFLSIYIIKLFKMFFKSFAPQYLYHLLCCNSPPYFHSPYSLLFKTVIYFYLYIIRGPTSILDPMGS